MTDDAIFMVPGREPFGKPAFAAAAEGMTKARIEGTSEIQELQVLGDWAYLRNPLEMTVTPPDGGAPVRRSEYTLTRLRKGPTGDGGSRATPICSRTRSDACGVRQCCQNLRELILTAYQGRSDQNTIRGCRVPGAPGSLAQGVKLEP
jgi:hypothetical protein